jgi:hypothetical protein
MSRDRSAGAALYLLFVGVYATTLCPSVYVEGSGELIGATWWLGTPHPTGYPLYALLGRLLASFLPGLSPAMAVNAATALMAAGAGPALFFLLRLRGLSHSSSFAAAMVLGFGQTFWSQAVVAEVYGLFVLVSILMLSAGLISRSHTCRSRWLLLCGYIAGIATTCHLQAVLFLPSVLGVCLLRGRQHLSSLPADVLRLLAGGVAGASLLLYLVLRNGIGPGFHWETLASAAQLWDHMTGALYRTSFLALPAPALSAGLLRLTRQLASEWPLFVLAIASWGAFVAWRRDRVLALAVAGGMSLNLAAGLLYHRDPAGIHVFFLLLLTGVCVFVGTGLGDLQQRLSRHLPHLLSAIVVLAAGLSPLLANHHDADRSAAIFPDAYGRAILEELPRGAILLTDGDDASFIIDYLHRIEAVRPDVVVYNRMGRGSDLAAGVGPGPEQSALRRRREAQLLAAGTPVHFLVPRMMPARGYRFVPLGLSYLALKEGDEVPERGQEHVDLLQKEGTGRDPWVQKLLANCWYMEAEALVASDRAAAIKAYEAAVQKAPRSQSIHYNVSLKLLRLNELAKASKIIQEAIQIDPLRRGPYELAAAILRKMGKSEEAMNVHKRALDMARIP